MEGGALLDELPGPLRVVLWQRLRDTYLWATTLPDLRGDLFAPDSLLASPYWILDPDSLPPALSTALPRLADVVKAPLWTDGSGVARACLAISTWAAEHGYSVTEQGFAEVAAFADRTDPECAYVAGRAARRRGLFESGREWFRRSIGLARRRDDAAAYSLAYLGWSLLEEQAGNGELARRKLVRAWRAAKRGGVRRLMGMARQAMIPYAVAEGNREMAYRHARAAAKLYDQDDDDLPRLAIDLGALLSLYQHYAPALQLYEAALPRLLRPADRVAAIANIARAAAAVGQRDRFEECWPIFEAAMAIENEHLAPSIVEIAEGARTLGQLSRAHGLARELAKLASKRGDKRILAMADALDELIRAGAPVDRDRKAPVAVRTFVARFIGRVERMRITHPDQ
jgi:hypothetical protein